ncbi:calcium-binding protein [Leisingera sp. MMG026]|uniref:calcium-binding protein n=1 Tax=Leisingera sp. MMG026 TaxID=2909982 RepID=UPI001F3B7282|nr:calcium-binding protein [Leisingera sp. MMG026]MCF6432144.1 hypothetical protein [Leisingera sp. MMG026]
MDGGAGSDTIALYSDDEGGNWLNDSVNGGSGSDILLLVEVSGFDIRLGTGFDLKSVGVVDASDREIFLQGGGDYSFAGVTFKDGDAVVDGRLTVSGSGSTMVFGTGNDDVITGAGGNDTIEGNTGDDILSGKGGDDTLTGHYGDDVLNGGNGDDSLDGGYHHDLLTGGDGNDTLFGSYGKDTLIGGAGHDDLNGSNDNDTLDGGTGNDTLKGGPGSDTFIFHASTDNDVITDFGNGGDKLSFDKAAFDVETANDIIAMGVSMPNGSTFFDFGGGNTLTVYGHNVDSGDILLF